MYWYLVVLCMEGCCCLERFVVKGGLGLWGLFIGVVVGVVKV